MDVLTVDHPLAKARLTVMRDARTDNAARPTCAVNAASPKADAGSFPNASA